MASSKQIHRIATNPQAHREFLLYGRLPETVEPRSPLIDLLSKISPRDRAAIIGLTVDPALGYSGSRQFQSAETALRWMRPDREMFTRQSWPAESWRDKRFAQRLMLEDVLAKASRWPPNLAERYPRLCRVRAIPGSASAPGTLPDDSATPPQSHTP